VLGIADLDQHAAVFFEQGAQGDALVVAARRQGQYARRVEQMRGGIETRRGA
jgi:hypothetical protein